MTFLGEAPGSVADASDSKFFNLFEFPIGLYKGSLLSLKLKFISSCPVLSLKYFSISIYFSGAMVIMTTGLFIAQTSYIWFMPNQWAFYGLNTAGYVHALVSWNVAFIVGSALAAFAVWKFQKDKIYVSNICEYF